MSARPAAKRRAPKRAARAVGRSGAPALARLWAPWRMAYLRVASEPAGCLFCRVQRSKADARNLVLARLPHALLMLNRYPYAPAHLMVATARHAPDFSGLGASERRDVLELVALAERALRAEYGPHGMNVGANLGRVAGAGFPGHLHLHVVPRWEGDTNFMPTLAATRVLPESLAATWRRLARAITALASRPAPAAREKTRRGAARAGRGSGRRGQSA